MSETRLKQGHHQARMGSISKEKKGMYATRFGKWIWLARLSVAVAAASIFIAACTVAPAPKQTTTVKIGDLGFMDDAPYYIALAKGYFAEQDIVPDFQRFNSAVEMIAPMSTGELNVGRGAITAGLFNAAARGATVKVVATNGYTSPGNDANWLMVRADLKNQIKTVADLKGKKVSLIAPGSAPYYMLGMGLRASNLSLKDIEITNVPPPDMAAAFANSSIDAAFPVEPIVTLIEQQGTAVKLIQGADMLPKKHMQVSVLMFSDTWAKSNPDVAKRFVVAWIKGLRDYYGALMKGPNRAEVVKIIADKTTLKDLSMYDKVAWNGTDPDGYVDQEDMSAQQGFYLENGLTPQKVELDKVVDNSFVDAAIQKLGKYKK